MPQLNGPAVNCHTDAQRTTVIAPFPITLVLVAIGAKALQIIGVALKPTIAMRAPDVVDLCCDSNIAAKLTVFAKRPSAQGLRARDLAPVSRAVICAIGIEGCCLRPLRHGRRKLIWARARQSSIGRRAGITGGAVSDRAATTREKGGRL